MPDMYATPDLCGPRAENGYVSMYLTSVDMSAASPGECRESYVAADIPDV